MLFSNFLGLKEMVINFFFGGNEFVVIYLNF